MPEYQAPLGRVGARQGDDAGALEMPADSF